MTRLVEKLTDGPIDIIGDIHGEHQALLNLLDTLGCDPKAGTATRPIAFVGDLVDRGPDSPGVVDTVMKLVESGVAQCVLGNHELNILLGSRKEGNGWFYADPSDHHQFIEDGDIQQRPFNSVLATSSQAADYLDFFRSLPLVLAREDLRVVHACWDSEAIARLPDHADVRTLTREWSKAIHAEHKARGLWAREKAEWAEFAELKRLDVPPTRDLEAHAIAASERQSNHPVKVLTSGREERIPFENMFFVGGKWRFVKRHNWWNHYQEQPAVVVGHYWRRRYEAVIPGKPDAWATAAPTDWAGPHRNVFCVDYSVGRRFQERAMGTHTQFRGGLAALRWPERTLIFDDDTQPVATTGWSG